MAQGSLKIGRIAGIDIELHWLFILLILVFLYLSPTFGFVLILLFLCVLVHELSHSITAQRNGIKVSRIILLPIGGASIINELQIDPKVEFNIAIAGPVMSLLLGALFGVAVIFTPPGMITLLVQVLFVINILLGAFNILPAFPMDGGRVVRSYLQRRRSFYDATMITARISKYCMALIVIATVAFVLVPSSYSMGTRELTLVWDLVIVFFLYEGMKAEEGAVIIGNETKGLKIRDAVSRRYSVIYRDASSKSLYSLLKRRKEHIILTRMPRGEYALVNVFDRKAVARASSVSELAVEIPNIQASTSVSDTLSRIEDTSFRVAAVLEGSRLLGVATGQYITAFLALHMAGKTRRKGLNS